MMMKKTRSVIAATIITLLAFGATVYTSCNKDRCSNVTCQNGGTCLNGYCTCPTGYEGDRCEIKITTTLQYWNHGYEDIMLTLNNVAYIVPAGRSKGFSGGNGDSLKGNAFTQGHYGVPIKWDSLFNRFPASGTTTIDLNIPSDYFYLYVRNDSASGPIRYIYVDQNTEFGPQGVVNLPAPYLPYGSEIGLGYFHAVDSSTVYVKSAANDGQWWFRKSDGTLPLSMTQNQYARVTCN